jgi:pyridoxal phosphate enzyme (YggS family)
LPSSIRLIAVSKTFPADDVRVVADSGQTEFGENKVQEGADKRRTLESLALTWHLIGHLQSNKVKKAVAAFAWIQSVDSVELCRKLDLAARNIGVSPKVLVQLDLAHESTKHGADEAAAADIVKAALDARQIDLRGLMVLPPFPERPDDSRPWFRRLRDLRDTLVADGVPIDRLGELSMGMTHDFEVAIEEGATMVRVGTAIFGRRTVADRQAP